MLKALAIAALFAATAAQTAPQDASDPLTRPIAPQSSARWLGSQAPVKVYGNTYFVGFAGLSLALIRTDAGLILIDGGVPQSVAAVEANIRKLGFRATDIKLILSTEPHFDHAGGLAALQRDSGGSTVLAGAAAVKALRQGRSDPDDPQFADLPAFPAVPKVRAVRDGEQIRLGSTVVTARAMPAHTLGSTSWTWRSCEANRSLNMVFGSSLNPISSDGYRFTADKAHGDLTAAMRRTYRAFAALPCDILISAHPDNSGAAAGLKALAAGRTTPNPMIDPAACRAYAAKYEALFDKRLADEKAGRQ